MGDRAMGHGASRVIARLSLLQRCWRCSSPRAANAWGYYGHATTGADRARQCETRKPAPRSPG